MSVLEYEVIPRITVLIHSLSEFYTFPFFFSITAILPWILILTAIRNSRSTQHNTMILYFVHVKNLPPYTCATTLTLFIYSCLIFVRKISQPVLHQISMFINHFIVYFICCEMPSCVFKKCFHQKSYEAEYRPTLRTAVSSRNR